MSTFSEKLKFMYTELMKPAKITKKQVYDSIPVSRNCYNEWENGKRLPYGKTYHKLEEVTGIKAEYFIDDSIDCNSIKDYAVSNDQLMENTTRKIKAHKIEQKTVPLYQFISDMKFIDDNFLLLPKESYKDIVENVACGQISTNDVLKLLVAIDNHSDNYKITCSDSYRLENKILENIKCNSFTTVDIAKKILSEYQKIGVDC